MPPSLGLEQIVDQITLDNHEAAMSGRWLFGELSSLMDLLKSGRSPRSLDLGYKLEPAENWLLVLDQILTEWSAYLPALKEKVAMLIGEHPGEAAPLEKSIPEIEREFAFWLAFGERSRALLKKLRLISDEEKLSSLGRAPLQDVWEDISRMAIGA